MIRTGAQYRDSIRDGRQVYIGGERVKDVTTHPMFKPLVDIRARFYDMQHEPATRDIMSYADGGETHAIANKLPYTPGRLVGQAPGDRCRSSKRSAAW